MVHLQALLDLEMLDLSYVSHIFFLWSVNGITQKLTAPAWNSHQSVTVKTVTAPPVVQNNTAKSFLLHFSKSTETPEASCRPCKMLNCFSSYHTCCELLKEVAHGPLWKHSGIFRILQVYPDMCDGLIKCAYLHLMERWTIGLGGGLHTWPLCPRQIKSSWIINRWVEVQGLATLKWEASHSLSVPLPWILIIRNKTWLFRNTSSNSGILGR